jgi:hypothetical protein
VFVPGNVWIGVFTQVGKHMFLLSPKIQLPSAATKNMLAYVPLCQSHTQFKKTESRRVPPSPAEAQLCLSRRVYVVACAQNLARSPPTKTWQRRTAGAQSVNPPMGATLSKCSSSSSSSSSGCISTSSGGVGSS